MGHMGDRVTSFLESIQQQQQQESMTPQQFEAQPTTPSTPTTPTGTTTTTTTPPPTTTKKMLSLNPNRDRDKQLTLSGSSGIVSSSVGNDNGAKKDVVTTPSKIINLKDIKKDTKQITERNSHSKIMERADDNNSNYGEGYDNVPSPSSSFSARSSFAPSPHLFISNLPIHATDDHLLEAFSQFGKIIAVYKKQGRQYGFVNFKTTEEAFRAKEHMNGTHFMDKMITVKFNKGQPSRILWVGGVSPYVTEEQLRIIFQKYGRIENIKRNPNANSACVRFESEEDAIAAVTQLQGKVLSGTHIQVGFAAQNDAAFNYLDSTRHLWVGNVDSNVESEDLHREFSKYGDIEKISVFSSKNYAFVDFKTISSASTARARLDGQLLGSMRLKVNFASGQPSKHLWIGSVHPEVTQEDLRSAFGLFGHIKSCHKLARSNCAFVDFENVDDAVTAIRDMQGKFIGQWPIKIDFGPVNDNNDYPEEPQHTSLYVGFPHGVFLPSEGKIHAEFSQYGEVLGVRMFPGKNYAFVNFTNAADAQRARDELDYKLFGENCRVKFANRNDTGPNPYHDRYRGSPPPAGWGDHHFDQDIGRSRSRSRSRSPRGKETSRISKHHIEDTENVRHRDLEHERDWFRESDIDEREKAARKEREKRDREERGRKEQEEIERKSERERRESEEHEKERERERQERERRERRERREKEEREKERRENEARKTREEQERLKEEEKEKERREKEEQDRQRRETSRTGFNRDSRDKEREWGRERERDKYSTKDRDSNKRSALGDEHNFRAGSTQGGASPSKRSRFDNNNSYKTSFSHDRNYSHKRSISPRSRSSPHRGPSPYSRSRHTSPSESVNTSNLQPAAFPPASPVSPPHPSSPLHTPIQVWAGALAKGDVEVCRATCYQSGPPTPPFTNMFGNTLFAKNRTDLTHLVSYLIVNRSAVYYFQPERPSDHIPFTEFADYFKSKKRVGIVSFPGYNLYLVPPSDPACIQLGLPSTNQESLFGILAPEQVPQTTTPTAATPDVGSPPFGLPPHMPMFPGMPPFFANMPPTMIPWAMAYMQQQQQNQPHTSPPPSESRSKHRD